MIGKSQVCKDLVIWPEPSMTCWDDEGRPMHSPITIVEWKVQGFPRKPTRNLETSMEGDVAWLSTFTERFRSTLGIAVGVELSAPRRLTATRVKAAEVEPDWLHLRGGQ